jgi:hypothetical protein
MHCCRSDTADHDDDDDDDDDDRELVTPRMRNRKRVVSRLRHRYLVGHRQTSPDVHVMMALG